jgi:hypothetical protein
MRRVRLCVLRFIGGACELGWGWKREERMREVEMDKDWVCSWVKFVIN